MTAPEAFAVLLLGAWFVLTVIRQVTTRATWQEHGRLGWAVPEWRFFAPFPSTADYRLVYRLRANHEQPSGLRVYSVSRAERLRALWNPGGRRQKILRDMMQALCSLAERVTKSSAGLPDRLILSEPYLLLLNLVQNEIRLNDGLVQFGIVRSEPGGEDDLIFLSRWHRVGAQKDI